MPKKLGKNLRKIREDFGNEPRQIVDMLNYKDTPLRASQISQYETGQREPTMMLVLAYARLAGISTDVLIDDKMRLPPIQKGSR